MFCELGWGRFGRRHAVDDCRRCQHVWVHHPLGAVIWATNKHIDNNRGSRNTSITPRNGPNVNTLGGGDFGSGDRPDKLGDLDGERGGGDAVRPRIGDNDGFNFVTCRCDVALHSINAVKPPRALQGTNDRSRDRVNGHVLRNKHWQNFIATYNVGICSGFPARASSTSLSTRTDVLDRDKNCAKSSSIL
jgi:hypothetical protein